MKRTPFPKITWTKYQMSKRKEAIKKKRPNYKKRKEI